MKNIKSIFGFFAKIAFMSMALLMSSSLALAGGNDHGADKKHIVGVFLGATNDAHSETDGTAGIEYEYKFTEHFGIGAVYEHSPDAHNDDGVSVYLASAYWHPYAGWRIGLGIGEEKLHGSHGHEESLYRASIAYDFHIGGFGIAPTFNLDRVDGESIEVYGVTLSKAF